MSPLVDSLGQALALSATAVVTWAAFLIVGPFACIAVLLMDVAGAPLPAGAGWIHAGTAASWTIFLAGLGMLKLAGHLLARLRPARAGRPARPRVRGVRIGGFGGPRVDPLLAKVWAQARAREASGQRPASPRATAPPPRPKPAAAPPRQAPPPAVDPRKVLGVGPGATPDEIRSAYRALIKKHHPDRVGSPDLRAAATRRTREIREAYEALRRRPMHPA